MIYEIYQYQSQVDDNIRSYRSRRKTAEYAELIKNAGEERKELALMAIGYAMTIETLINRNAWV